MKKNNPNLKITELIKQNGGKKLISIEVNPHMGAVDIGMIQRIQPMFLSIVWIGRKDRAADEPSLRLSKQLILRGYTVLLHIPCGYYTVKEMENILSLAKNYGIRNIFAIKGGGSAVAAMANFSEFTSASNFIEFVRTTYGDTFDIGVAGFPNVNPWVRSMENEMFILKKKVVSGANFILTQACMDYDQYIEFKETCVKYAIDVPIIMGVMLLKSYGDFIKIRRMALLLCKQVLREAFSMKKKGQFFIRTFGRQLTINIIKKMLSTPASAGVHIFTINNLHLTYNILKEAGAILR